jgi:hypothetical protein
MGPRRNKALMHSHDEGGSTKAWFAPVSGSEPGAVRHYMGLPRELGGEGSETFPPPAAVAIELLREGGVLLTRLTAEGDPVGDTWHEDWNEAIEQATFEYGTRIGEWKPVPGARKDLENYVAEQLRCAK